MVKNNFKIQGGGFRLSLFIAIAIVFWAMFVFGLLEVPLAETDPKDIAILLAFGIILCPYTSLQTYKFWKYNYIIITDGELLISFVGWADFLPMRFLSFLSKNLLTATH